LIVVSMALGLAIRLLALRHGWNMPRFVYREDLYRGGSDPDPGRPVEDRIDRADRENPSEP
jgi:hypothetical protein